MIDAIFPGCTEVVAEGILSFRVPNHEEVTIQLAIPTNYPNEMPSVIQVVALSRKFPDPLYLERNVAEILDTVFVEGDVVLFELIGELEQLLDNHDREFEESQQIAKSKMQQAFEKMTLSVNEDNQTKRDTSNRQPGCSVASDSATSDKSNSSRGLESSQDYTAGWVRSDPILDRGSTFLAFAREVHSVEEAKEHLATLTCDRKILRATHNMNTWRIRGKDGVVFQDCDDDGETAAGLRMLHLLTVC